MNPMLLNCAHASFAQLLLATTNKIPHMACGSFPVIVSSSVDAAEFFLKTHNLAFLDRPRMACGKYTVYNYSGMLWSHYGPYWRQIPKMWVTELLSQRQLRLTEHIRGEEVRAMLRKLRQSAGRAVVLKDHLRMAFVNMISRMVLGKKYIVEEDGSAATPEEFRWMIDKIVFLNGVLTLGDMVPWLGWLDPQGYIGRMKRLGKMFDRFIEHVLCEHNERRRRREGEAFIPKDMVDLLVQLAENPNLEAPIDQDGVKASILELIVGGIGTSAASVEWAMCELLRKTTGPSMEEKYGIDVTRREPLQATLGSPLFWFWAMMYPSLSAPQQK